MIQQRSAKVALQQNLLGYRQRGNSSTRVLNKPPGHNFVSVYGNKVPTHLTKPLQKPEVIRECC